MTKQHGTYYNKELCLNINDEDYMVNVHATGTWKHYPGRLYLRNGDPGYPDEDEFTIDCVEATWYKWSDDIDDWAETPANKDMHEQLEEYLYENPEEWRWTDEC